MKEGPSCAAAWIGSKMQKEVTKPHLCSLGDGENDRSFRHDPNMWLGADEVEKL